MHLDKSFEAPTKLRDSLERVALGKEVTLTRGGAPVAGLVPMSTDNRHREQLPRTIERLKAARRGRTLGGLSVRAMIEEGRR